MYQNLTPKMPVGHRDRCLLGFMVFQGLKAGELWELRLSDIDFESAQVFVQEQRISNSRYIKLEPAQMMHLYDYVNKYRKAFLHHRENKDIDRLFLSLCTSENLLGTLQRLSKQIKRKYPQMIDFKHLRASVITHWQEDEGIIEAMYKAGHRYVTSTERYKTSKFDGLQKLLVNMHPLELMNI